MKTDKVKGLKIWTEKVGSNYYIKCETDGGKELLFPHGMDKIGDMFKKVVDILLKASWENVDNEPNSEQLRVYQEARFETSKID